MILPSNRRNCCCPLCLWSRGCWRPSTRKPDSGSTSSLGHSEWPEWSGQHRTGYPKRSCERSPSWRQPRPLTISVSPGWDPWGSGLTMGVNPDCHHLRWHCFRYLTKLKSLRSCRGGVRGQDGGLQMSLRHRSSLGDWVATSLCSVVSLHWPCDVGDGLVRDGVEDHRPCCGGTSVRLRQDVCPSVRDVRLVRSLCPTLVVLASSFLKMQFCLFCIFVNILIDNPTNHFLWTLLTFRLCCTANFLFRN
jgi:hypothetical protein